MKFVT